MSKEMNIEEAIESLNKFIKIVGSKEYRDDDGWNGYYNTEMRYLGQAIETVLVDRERLFKDNQIFLLQNSPALKIYIDNNYISKDKIKEKIEELKPYIYQRKNAPQDFLQYRVKAKIQVLQELLEKEK